MNCVQDGPTSRLRKPVYLFNANFGYGKDGRFMVKDDLLDNAWDRTMQYDFAGRLTFNDFGMGRAADNQSDKRVYEQSIGLDAFSNMTSREGVHWDNQIQFYATYTNGRKNPVANESLLYFQPVEPDLYRVAVCRGLNRRSATNGRVSAEKTDQKTVTKRAKSVD